MFHSVPHNKVHVLGNHVYLCLVELLHRIVRVLHKIISHCLPPNHVPCRNKYRIAPAGAPRVALGNLSGHHPDIHRYSRDDVGAMFLVLNAIPCHSICNNQLLSTYPFP